MYNIGMTEQEPRESTPISSIDSEDNFRFAYFQVPEESLERKSAYLFGIDSVNVLRSPDPNLIPGNISEKRGEEVVSGVPYKTRRYEQRDSEVRDGEISPTVTFFEPDSSKFWGVVDLPQILTTSRLEISALDSSGVPVTLRQDHFIRVEEYFDENSDTDEEYESGWFEFTNYVAIRNGEAFWIGGDKGDDVRKEIRDIGELSMKERDSLAEPFLPKKMPDYDPRDPE